LLSYYSKNKLKDACNTLYECLEEEQINFEIIIIDDGSKDGSYDIAKGLEKQYNNIYAYQLSKNYTSHYSIFAGLSVCQGDCAIPVPDDNQLPYNTVIEAYKIWQNGGKIIIPHRTKRKDFFISKVFSSLFYFLMNKLSDVVYPHGGADTFLIDREVINILNDKIKPIHTTTITEVLRLGFDPIYLPFIRPIGTTKKSRWSFRKKWQLALDTFFSSSSFPVRFISVTGLFFSLISFCLIFFYGYIKIFGNENFWGIIVPGWTSIILFISFFSGLILLSLGIISEYIWRIFEDVKNRPGYIIKKDIKTNDK